MIFYIILAITGNYDPLLGSAADVVFIGLMLSGIAATLLCIGTAIAVYILPRVALRHAKRFNVATTLSGAGAFFISLGIGYVWKPPGDFIGLGVATILISAATAYSVLKILFHMNILSPPAHSECPHCGYPIGVSSICTECGKAVSLSDRVQE